MEFPGRKGKGFRDSLVSSQVFQGKMEGQQELGLLGALKGEF